MWARLLFHEANLVLFRAIHVSARQRSLDQPSWRS
jgi:hypothetical protein